MWIDNKLLAASDWAVQTVWDWFGVEKRIFIRAVFFIDNGLWLWCMKDKMVGLFIVGLLAIPLQFHYEFCLSQNKHYLSGNRDKTVLSRMLFSTAVLFCGIPHDIYLHRPLGVVWNLIFLAHYYLLFAQVPPNPPRKRDWIEELTSWFNLHPVSSAGR